MGNDRNWLCLTAMFALVFGYSGAALGQESPEALLRDAAKGIVTQELAVKNITLRAKSKLEAWDDGTQRMEPAGTSDITAIYDGHPCGKARIDVHQMLSPWANGPSPFYLQTFTTTYNGRVGEVFTTREGDFTGPSDTSEGSVGGKRPEIMDDLDERTAWRFSLFGYTEGQRFSHDRFSSLIAPGQEGVTLVAQWAIGDDNNRYLRVVRSADDAKINWGKYEFWLDPRRNYAIAKCFEYRGILVRPGKAIASTSKAIAERWEVSEFSEPSPGVFFPKHVEYEIFSPTRGASVPSLWTRRTVDVSDVKINDPRVDDNAFLLQFPKDAMVQNKATNQTLIIGGTPEEQQKAIEDAVSEAAKAATTAPSPDTSTQP